MNGEMKDKRVHKNVNSVMNLIDKLDINEIPDPLVVVYGCLLKIGRSSAMRHDDSGTFVFTNIKHDSDSLASEHKSRKVFPPP